MTKVTCFLKGPCQTPWWTANMKSLQNGEARNPQCELALPQRYSCRTPGLKNTWAALNPCNHGDTHLTRLVVFDRKVGVALCSREAPASCWQMCLSAAASAGWSRSDIFMRGRRADFETPIRAASRFIKSPFKANFNDLFLDVLRH